MFALTAFFGSLCRNPVRLGCIAPSSPALSKRLASLVDRESRCVLEVGAGTGAVTKALLEHGVAAERLWVVELDPLLANYLRQEFRRVHVFCGDATELRRLLPPGMLGQVDSVVSSLPLRNMNAETHARLVRAAFGALRPRGQLLQFTYGLRSPIVSDDVHLTAERIDRVWTNFPPATVWRYRRAGCGAKHAA